MSRDRIPERVRWTVSHLGVEPHHTVLEIGAAPGVAAGLICDVLTTGRMTAIDRSPVGAARIERRNRHHVAAGRLEVRAVALADLDPGDRRYDRAFAVNVNGFWTTPATKELAVLERLLASDGTLLLAFTAPDGRHARVLDQVETRLADAGFRCRGRLVDAAAAGVVADPP